MAGENGKNFNFIIPGHCLFCVYLLWFLRGGSDRIIRKNVTLYFSFAIVNKPQNNTKKVSAFFNTPSILHTVSDTNNKKKKRKVSFDTKKKKIISESENLLHQNTSG